MKTKQARAEMAGVLLVLLLTALPVGWWGIEDFTGALTFTGRITGAALILVSLMTLAGALAVVDHWARGTMPYSGLFALICTGVAFLVNAMLLLQASTDGERIIYPVLLGLLTVGSAWAAVMVWRTVSDMPAPKLAAALIVSSVIAIANFSYQNLYQPFHRGARPLITIGVGKPMLSKDRKRFAVPVDIRLENHSDVGFYVFGAEFHAMGEKVPLTPEDRLRTQWRTDAAQTRQFRERSPLSRREVHQPGQLVVAHPWMGPGDWIEANDSFVTRAVVQLPIDTPYDHLAFYATANFGRKDRVGLDRYGRVEYSWRGGKVAKWAKSKDIDCVIYHARVSENNAIDKHTRYPRYVTAYWQFGQQGAGVTVSIARNGQEDRTPTDAEVRDVSSRYGLVDAGAGPIERTLWDIKTQR
ncbi:hypothetical protein ACIRU3_08075 [Streptomyces sp. NPDC101151]|uniref:hypothetical protein n=1 Tax=Streptomyces sp. NPDC101151 TaxID=3366115 RepID=UPI003803157A